MKVKKDELKIKAQRAFAMPNMTFDISISTHSGLVREVNEDSFSLNGYRRRREKSALTSREQMTGGAFMLEVCDGMGGEACGDLAAETAAVYSAALFEKLNTLPAERLEGAVNEYVAEVNGEICRLLGNSGSHRGGTTFALVYIRGGVAYPFSLGDSRIYLCAGGNIDQISFDHTLAMRKYMANIYTLEEAENSPDSHKLTLFLGVDVDGRGLTAQTYEPIQLEHGMKLLLCSDGLYDMCPLEEIARIMSGETLGCAKQLVKSALAHGGIDNITCAAAGFIK